MIPIKGSFFVRRFYMNYTKIRLHKLAGMLSIAYGVSIVLVQLATMVRGWGWGWGWPPDMPVLVPRPGGGIPLFSVDNLIWFYIHFWLGMAVLFAGISLYSNPYDNYSKKINEKQGASITAISIVGACLLLYTITICAAAISENIIITWQSLLSMLLIGIPSAVLPVAVVVLLCFAIRLKHPDNRGEQPLS